MISSCTNLLLIVISAIALAASPAAHSEYHHPQKMIAAIKQAKQPGKAVYQHYCAMCHSEKPMINLGAPRIGNQSDWQHRPHKTAKDIDNLLAKMNEGIGAMPPRGGCFECDDQLLRKAIIYLLPKRDLRDPH